MRAIDLKGKGWHSVVTNRFAERLFPFLSQGSFAGVCFNQLSRGGATNGLLSSHKDGAFNFQGEWLRYGPRNTRPERTMRRGLFTGKAQH